ncbi:MAG: methionine--tRNA ligase [Roseiflexaceae bacterium]
MISPEAATQRFYITTAIPYVNAKPHIGFALEAVQTDALARYQRWKGADVRFLTGTDENSLKNVRAAEQAGIPTQALVDHYAAEFYALRTALNLSFDDFIRTSTDPRHRAGVERLWQACAQRGDIYTRPYRGLYCVGCEQFYAEDELADGLCPEHLTAPEIVEEQNYFFRLSRYADQLRELIATDRLRIVPQSRKNEVLSFLRGGLADFSISRSRARARGWGIAVPGDPDQVIYVWFDALGNYITALGYADDAPLYQRYWADNPRRVHVIGKGIIRFHAVYWPAILLSAGVPLPTTILVHGYVTAGGEKISKSRGNSIDPVALAERYGTDALRYYLLREIPPTEDGDFTLARFARAYNTGLADQLGNLLQRVLGMVSRYYGGSVPAPGQPDDLDQQLIATAQVLAECVDTALERYAPNEALAAIWDLIAAANKYVVVVQPWTLAKRRAESAAEQRLATSLYNLIETLRLVAHTLVPLLPATAVAITRQLGIALDPGGERRAALAWGGYPAGTPIQPGEVLFPKHDQAEVDE